MLLACIVVYGGVNVNELGCLAATLLGVSPAGRVRGAA